jgi:hypothetical protein
MVPPQALGQGPSQNEQMLGQQLQQMQQALQATMDELAKEKGKSQARLEKREVEVYDAITKRLDILLKNAGLTQPQTAIVANEAVRESQDVPISDTYEGHDTQQGRLPLEDHEIPLGGQRGADGHVYAPHPEMPGVMARVTKEI